MDIHYSECNCFKKEFVITRICKLEVSLFRINLTCGIAYNKTGLKTVYVKPRHSLNAGALNRDSTV